MKGPGTLESGRWTAVEWYGRRSSCLAYAPIASGAINRSRLGEELRFQRRHGSRQPRLYFGVLAEESHRGLGLRGFVRRGSHRISVDAESSSGTRRRKQLERPWATSVWSSPGLRTRLPKIARARPAHRASRSAAGLGGLLPGAIPGRTRADINAGLRTQQAAPNSSTSSPQTGCVANKALGSEVQQRIDGIGGP